MASVKLVVLATHCKDTENCLTNMLNNSYYSCARLQLIIVLQYAQVVSSQARRLSNGSPRARCHQFTRFNSKCYESCHRQSSRPMATSLTSSRTSQRILLIRSSPTVTKRIVSSMFSHGYLPCTYVGRWQERCWRWSSRPVGASFTCRQTTQTWPFIRSSPTSMKKIVNLIFSHDYLPCTRDWHTAYGTKTYGPKLQSEAARRNDAAVAFRAWRYSMQWPLGRFR